MIVDQSPTQAAEKFVSQQIMFGRFKKLHFIGIGGAGMSGISEILHNLGYVVTGSDATPSEVTEYLSSLGLTIHPGHDVANLSEVDVVVISSAVGEDNPEVQEARRRGIPVIKRAEMLGELMRLKFSIGIAGTHGKTTTTSMVGRILQQAQLHPTLVVGGVVAELGTGASLGKGDYLVAEVDEYDRSIEAMFPGLAVLLNIEPDHLDCYADMDDLRGAFLSYVNRVPFYGSVVMSADDENVARLRPHVTRPLATFGFSPEADYRASEITTSASGSKFVLACRGERLGEVTVPIPGRHNVANATAAVAAAMELDIPFETAASALAGFSGVARRFEIIGEAGGVLVIDDYAHHPTEIKATLIAAREAYGRRIIAVFQPHLYSRTQAFMDEFVAVLALADLCVLTDIYPAREEPIEGITSEAVRQAAVKQGYDSFSYVGVKENAVEEVGRLARKGDMVVILGAGSITHIRQMILDRLGAE